MKLKPFSISKLLENQNNNTLIKINPLPFKICNFDCVFCPFGRTLLKTADQLSFKCFELFLQKLKKNINTKKIDYIYIYPEGESLMNHELSRVIDIIKKTKIKIKLISNGYLYNLPENIELLNKIDEVIGEIVVTREDYFQKIMRPLSGYTLAKHITNLSLFKKNFKGKFILDITILKKYSDSREDAMRIKNLLNIINPDYYYLHTPAEGKFAKAFDVSSEKLQEIEEIIKGNL